MRTGGALQRHSGPTCSSTYGGTWECRRRQFRSPIANFAHPSPFDAQDRASRPPLGPHIRRARSRRERIAALRDGGGAAARRRPLRQGRLGGRPREWAERTRVGRDDPGRRRAVALTAGARASRISAAAAAAAASAAAGAVGPRASEPRGAAAAAPDATGGLRGAPARTRAASTARRPPLDERWRARHERRARRL